MLSASVTRAKTTACAVFLLLIGCAFNPGMAQSNTAKPTCCVGADGVDPCFELAKRDMIRWEVIGLSSLPRTIIAELYATDQIVPVAGDPNVVGPPTSYLRTWVERLDLLSGGVFTITLLPVAGTGTIRFSPVFPTNPHVSMYWRCDSPDRRDVYALIPGCIYSGR